MTPSDQTSDDRKRRLIEQILGDESLTDDLVDEAARLLLQWGTARLDEAFPPSGELSSDELSARTSRLRRMMRRINESAGQSSAERQAQRVRMLLSRIEETGDIGDVEDPDQIEEAE